MAKITIEVDDQTMSRVAAVARARHSTVEDIFLSQANQFNNLAPMALHNPAHTAIMANLVRPPGYYESEREEIYDRDQQRAELYAANRARLLLLVDETEGDSAGQPWSRSGFMFADCFIDTNVLFYAALGRFSDQVKYFRAREVLAETHFGLSGQVIQEFFVNVTRKTAKPLSTVKAIEWIEALGDRPFVAIDRDVVFAAAQIADRYQISYWDAALIAAAERLGAPILYTEDLNHDQTYGSVRVVNPFRVN